MGKKDKLRAKEKKLKLKEKKGKKLKLKNKADKKQKLGKKQRKKLKLEKSRASPLSTRGVPSAQVSEVSLTAGNTPEPVAPEATTQPQASKVIRPEPSNVAEPKISAVPSAPAQDTSASQSNKQPAVSTNETPRSPENENGVSTPQPGKVRKPKVSKKIMVGVPLAIVVAAGAVFLTGVKIPHVLSTQNSAVLNSARISLALQDSLNRNTQGLFFTRVKCPTTIKAGSTINCSVTARDNSQTTVSVQVSNSGVLKFGQVISSRVSITSTLKKMIQAQSKTHRVVAVTCPELIPVVVGNGVQCNIATVPAASY